MSTQIILKKRSSATFQDFSPMGYLLTGIGRKSTLLGVMAIGLITGCATPRMADNVAMVPKHEGELQIFSIGYWKPGFMILTLTDSQKQYFTLTTARNDSLKVGQLFAAK